VRKILLAGAANDQLEPTETRAHKYLMPKKVRSRDATQAKEIELITDAKLAKNG